MSLYQKELVHHGIKGQKHGVRQVPWYPIDEYKKHLQNTGDKEGLKKFKEANAKIAKMNSLQTRYDKLQTEKKSRSKFSPVGKVGKYAGLSAIAYGLSGGAMIIPADVYFGYYGVKKLSEIYVDKTTEQKVNKLINELEDMGYDYTTNDVDYHKAKVNWKGETKITAHKGKSYELARYK